MLAPQTAVSLAEAQDLIFLEAELLDAWRLDDWIKLYTDDMTYLVPSPGMPADASPDTSLFGEPGQAPEEAHRSFGISALDHGPHVREPAGRRA
jgi:Ring hydroxylating beta subunit